MKPTEASTNIKPTIALFVVLRADDTYFAGFDPVKREAMSTDSVFKAKMFPSKHDATLRPDERFVEVRISLDETNVSLSNPFRPRRRLPYHAVSSSHHHDVFEASPGVTQETPVPEASQGA